MHIQPLLPGESSTASWWWPRPSERQAQVWEGSDSIAPGENVGIWGCSMDKMICEKGSEFEHNRTRAGTHCENSGKVFSIVEHCYARKSKHLPICANSFMAKEQIRMLLCRQDQSKIESHPAMDQWELPHGPFRFGELSGAVGRSHTSRQACVVFVPLFILPLSEYLRYGSTCSSMLFHVYTIFTALKHALFREVRELLRQDVLPASRPVLSKACRWGWYGMTRRVVPESLHCWPHHHIPEIPSESHRKSPLKSPWITIKSTSNQPLRRLWTGQQPKRGEPQVMVPPCIIQSSMTMTKRIESYADDWGFPMFAYWDMGWWLKWTDFFGSSWNC